MALVIAGCATGGTPHSALAGTANSYVLDGIELNGVRIGQESAAREWQRPTANHVVTRTDDARLRDQLASDLGRELTLEPDAPLHLRVALTPQDTADFEGFAAETADLTLSAAVLDKDGVVLRTITLREAANAPLQRTASQRTRFDGALARLSRRLAQQL